ncbi:MAG: low temperature requirement protein A [Actinomycetota bacterium]|nr:low temperature requirement protein A [Actinomycetota bacterium]
MSEPEVEPLPPRRVGATVGWFEMFYDLVVVAALGLCNEAFLSEPSIETALSAIVSVAALAWVWFLTALFTNLFPGDDLVRRLLILVQMGFIVIAGLAVNQVNGLSNHAGLAAYGGALLIVGLLFLQHRGKLANPRMLHGGLLALAGSAAICFIGVLRPIDEAGFFLAAALAVSMVAVLSVPNEKATVGGSLRSEHLQERRGIFIIIILGEGFAQLVRALDDLGTIPRMSAFSLTFLLAFALWWIYFDGTFSPREGHVIVRWRLSLLAHLTLIYGMGGALDILAVLTARHEEHVGHGLLIYFAVSIALVFCSFAVLGWTVNGRFGAAGWAQIGSSAVILAMAVLGSQGEELRIGPVMAVSSALVIANAVFSVWSDHARESGSWRIALRGIVKGGDTEDM